MNDANELQYKQISSGSKMLNRGIFLRLNEESMNKLQELSIEREENIQTVLRALVSAHGEELKPLMSIKVCNKVVRELNRIGNNMNQIAKHLNSGFRAGWYDSFDICAADISEIRQMLVNHVAR